MPSPIPPHDVQRALTALGVVPQDFETIRRVPFQQAQLLLQELKTKAKRAYKRLALELHPDRTAGDEAKASLFVLLGRVLEELEKTEVRPPAPPPAMMFVKVSRGPSWQQVVQHSVPWVQTTTVSSTSATTVNFTPAQVIRIVKMRPR